MAATVAAASVSIGQNPSAPVYQDIVNITGDAAYPNPGGAVVGGYDIDALIKARIGAGRTILDVIPVPKSGGTGPWTSSYDRASGKLKLWAFTGAEVANGVDVSTYATIPHRVISY